MLNFDLLALHKFRAIIKICIQGPYRILQTGFYFYGSASAGKSTLVDFFTKIVGNSKVVNLRPFEFSNAFSLQACIDKTLVFLSEVSQTLPNEAVNHLKLLLGRDLVSPSVKYSNIKRNCQFDGTVIITSNNPPDILSDAALVNRFIELLVRNFASRDPHLIKKLEAQIPQFINWAMAMPEKELLFFVRSDAFSSISAYENNAIVEFMLNEFFDNQRVLLYSHLEQKLISSFCGLKKVPTKKQLATDIVNYAAQLWNINLKKKVLGTKKHY